MGWNWYGFGTGLVWLLATPSPALILGGKITGGDALSLGGAFEELDAEGGFSVGRDTFESPNLYAFNEDQNIRIPDEIAVDIGRNPQAGEIVASHYVFFDPIWGTGQIGYVEFDAPILGVATSTRTLAASDYLLNTNVTYLNPTLRGLEPRDAVWIDPDNPFRLRVNWLASTPGDYVRVFTQRSPVAGMAPNDAHALLTERARPSKR